MDSNLVKTFAKKAGARICGISSINLFHDAPKGFSPTDYFPQTQSVISFALKTPNSVIKNGNRITYSLIEDMLLEQTHEIGLQLMLFFEKYGFNAMLIPSEPYEYWDEQNKTGKGMVSLKHIAYKSGLGVFGKNHLLYHYNYGNLIKLGAVATDAVLEADPIITGSYCAPGCNVCINSCPAGAISQQGVNQLKCRNHSSKQTLKGDMVYECNICRKVCVNAEGVHG